MNGLRIETERLLLLPISYDCMGELLEGKPCALEREGFALSDEWVTIELLRYFDILRSFMPPGGTPDGFYTWAIIERAARMVIGDVGFKGPPNELGAMDIGYGIAPASREKGYATEAVTAALRWVFAQPGVRRVSAECVEDNAPSVHILKKTGMREMLRDASTIYWELKNEDFTG